MIHYLVKIYTIESLSFVEFVKCIGGKQEVIYEVELTIEQNTVMCLSYVGFIHEVVQATVVNSNSQEARDYIRDNGVFPKCFSLNSAHSVTKNL